MFPVFRVGKDQFSYLCCTTLRYVGELLPSDLPLIEDLHITVPEAECFQVGTVSSCVDDLVVVQSLPGMPVLDLVKFSVLKVVD